MKQAIRTHNTHIHLVRIAYTMPIICPQVKLTCHVRRWRLRWWQLWRRSTTTIYGLCIRMWTYHLHKYIDIFFYRFSELDHFKWLPHIANTFCIFCRLFSLNFEFISLVASTEVRFGHVEACQTKMKSTVPYTTKHNRYINQTNLNIFIFTLLSTFPFNLVWMCSGRYDVLEFMFWFTITWIWKSVLLF